MFTQSKTFSSPAQLCTVALFSTALFVTSTLGAHASEAEKIAAMENQLNTASVMVSSLLKQYVPQKAVLGAATSPTKAEIQMQIDALRAEMATTDTSVSDAELQAQIAALLAQIAALNGGTSASAVPVRPACQLSLDKKVYTLGDTIKVSWKTTGSSHVEFVTDGPEKMTFPEGKLDTADSASVVASVQGIPMITLKVTSPTGQSIKCSKVFPVLANDATAKDARVAPLQAKLIHMANLSQKLVSQQEMIAGKILQLQIDTLTLQIKIDQIINGSKGEVKGASIVDFDSRVEKTEGNETRGDYMLDFTIQALDADVFVGPSAFRNKPSTSGNPDVIYRIVDVNGKTATSGRATAMLNSSQESNDNDELYAVDEGSSEDFTLVVTYVPKVAGSYRVEIKTLQWHEDNHTTLLQKTFKPGTYRSAALTLIPN